MGEPRDDLSALSISVVQGGDSERGRAWRAAALALLRRVKNARAGVTSPLDVLVTYYIPGPVSQPPWSGIRLGYHNRKDNLLLVQVALPDEDSDAPDAVVLEYLRQAIEVAEGWAVKRKKPYRELTAIRGIIERL